ncbi:hypothetical protein BDZ45DRAFT_750423 [Acephala macrosclerotiorum]|nr:hypothetical protein BDZ45DRAFT_750423 [Acephala macrosclerotiorum]
MREMAGSNGRNSYHNSESRQETLRRYCLVWWKDLGIEDRDWRRPIYFDYARDLVYVMCAPTPGPALFDPLIKFLLDHIGDHIKRLRHFEVKQLPLKHMVFKLLKWIIKEADQPSDEEEEEVEQEKVNPFQLYRLDPEWLPLRGILGMASLRDVTFTLLDKVRPADYVLEERLDTLWNYLDVCKVVFKNGDAPFVFVRWERKKHEGRGFRR